LNNLKTKVSDSPIGFDVLESKIVSLLNKLKDNHLLINQLKTQNMSLKDKVEQFEKDFSKIKVENESLKMTNSLLGGKEDKSLSKRKINNLIKEVDFCINQLSDFENQNE
jgi:predicted RNase H-like nuclease (RuvC/YqgF family)